MSRNWLSHILLCGFATFFLVISIAAQDRSGASPGLPAPYQKWLGEDVAYLITDEERTDFSKLETDKQRDKFIVNFWQRRNPNTTTEANPFKEEHYRRLAYANQHFAEGVPGWKSDRGRIYILYGPPDEREQHPGSSGTGESFPSDIWRYPTLKRDIRDVYFEFVDKCRCGRYELRHDPTRKDPRSSDQRLIPVPTAFQRTWQKYLNQDLRYLITDQERAAFYELGNDHQRDEFIEDFWERHNPYPQLKENLFKEEHYLRIGYTNKKFGNPQLAGWKTDRGHIYILYGPPDWIEQHFSDAASRRAEDLAGDQAIPYDWEVWHYQYIKDVGKDPFFIFVDKCACGRYEIPVGKDELNKYKPKLSLSRIADR